MTDRERIYLACLDPAHVGLLDELDRDCPESRVIDQAIGLADFAGGVAGGIITAIANYPARRWQGDEVFVAYDLIASSLWWQGLILELESTETSYDK